LAAGLVLGTGCVTNGRQILLKEYGASIPVADDAPLKGATICLKGFTCAPDLISLELKSKAEEPTLFKYADLTREQDKVWEQEMKALQKQKVTATKIGNMRNAFGMVMSHVYALNDPGAWLTESLKFDLEAHGAKVVDASQAASADASMGGTIQLCRTDMYMTVNGSLVVDLEVQPRQGAVRRKQIHTHGATAAMLASEGEYFHALRDARQKFAIFAIGELLEAMRANSSVASQRK
jgi:hypothetical protein